MSSFKTFKRFLSDRPAVNNPIDDKKYGMNDKDKRQQMSKTLYGSKTSQYKNDLLRRFYLLEDFSNCFFSSSNCFCNLEINQVLNPIGRLYASVKDQPP